MFSVVFGSFRLFSVFLWTAFSSASWLNFSILIFGLSDTVTNFSAVPSVLNRRKIDN